MRQKARAAGFGLVALAVMAVAVIVAVGALRARGDADFNRWVGWATVAAIPLAAAGVLLVLLDKIAPDDNSGTMNQPPTSSSLNGGGLLEDWRPESFTVP